MSKHLQEYKKALQNAKVYNSEVLMHTIDKDKLSKAYAKYKDCINEFCDITQSDLDSLIKYEHWLLGE
ncbi:MAG: hypothetical protein IJU58_00615 [Clostridia bacterium]|nr:hypothetical protein [Clostridia bacterium]